MMSPEEIIGEVAIITGVPAPTITGRRRTVPASRARFLAIAAIRGAHSTLTLQAVGDLFSRNHGSIIHSIVRHRDLLKTEPAYQDLAKKVCRSIFYGPATLR